MWFLFPSSNRFAFVLWIIGFSHEGQRKTERYGKEGERRRGVRKNQMVIVFFSVPGFSILLCIPWFNDLIWMIYSYTQYLHFRARQFSFLIFLNYFIFFCGISMGSPSLCSDWWQGMVIGNGLFQIRSLGWPVKSSPHIGVIYKNIWRNYGPAVSGRMAVGSLAFLKLMGFWAWFLCGSKMIYIHSSLSSGDTVN